MMNITFFIITFFLLQGFCLWVGKRASKSISTEDDYFLAGRKLRFFPLMMTLIATQVGGGLILGSAEEAYRYGWGVLLYPLGACLGLMALALGVGKRLARFKISTVAQIFEVVYGSPLLKKVASLLSIISLFFILVAQVIASKKFMLSLGVEGDLIFIAFWAIVIFYTVMGGFKAVVATDIVQAAFFILIFAGCFLYTFFSNPTLFTSALSTDGAFEFGSAKLTGWLLMPLLFMVIEQDMGQRCFAAKSGKTVSWASGLSALITILLCLIPVSFGILGKTMGITVLPGSSVFMSVIEATTSPLWTALVAAAILAAIISTADSLINAISSNVVQDFNRTKSVKQMRGLTIVIALASLCVSYAFHNVVDLLILSYELSVSALFVPIFAALFIKRGNLTSATAAIVCGTLGFILFRLYPIPFLPREVASLLLSGLGYWMGALKFKVPQKIN